MSIGERKAAENMRRRRFYAAAMSVNALIWSTILAGLAYAGLIGPAAWAVARQEAVLGKVFTGWLTKVNMPAVLWENGTVFISSYSGGTAHLTSGETIAISDITITHPLNVIAERAVTANTVTAAIVVGFVLLLAILLRPTDITDTSLLENDLTWAFEWPTPTTSEKQRQKSRARRQQRLEEFAAARAEADTADAETHADAPPNHVQERPAGVKFLAARLAEGYAND